MAAAVAGPGSAGLDPHHSGLRGGGRIGEPAIRESATPRRRGRALWAVLPVAGKLHRLCGHPGWTTVVAGESMMQLVKLSDDGRILRLRAQGPLMPGGTLSDADPLQEEFGSEVYARTVLLSFDGVDGINSAGVSWLLNANRRFRQAGGRLLIHSAPLVVMQALRLLRVDRVLELAESEAEAHQRLNGNAHQ